MVDLLVLFGLKSIGVITSFWFDYSPDNQVLLNGICRHTLLAPKDIDEVEDLGNDLFGLGVVHANHRVKVSLIELGRLDGNAQFRSMPLVDLLESGDAQLTDWSVSKMRKHGKAITRGDGDCYSLADELLTKSVLTCF